MMEPWIYLLLVQLLVCGFFLYIFYTEKATGNDQYYATCAAFAVLVHEFGRVLLRLYGVDPPLTDARLMVYRIEHGILFIYAWEVYKYVKQRILNAFKDLVD